MKNRTIDFVLLLRLSIPAMLLAGLAIYALAISHTVDRYTAYQALKETAGSDAIGMSSGYTARRAKQVDSLYSRLEVDTLQWKSQLWTYGAELSKTHTCVLTNYPAAVWLDMDGKEMRMQSLGFKGSFKDLMQVLKAVSQQPHIGQVQRVEFKKKLKDDGIQLSIDLIGISKILRK